MSREQLNSHQAEREAGPEQLRQGQTGGDIQGLPPHLYAQIMSLGPGDVVPLRNLLSLHREMAAKILEVASAQVGISTVQRAQAMVQQNVEVAPPVVAGAQRDELLSVMDDETSTAGTNRVAEKKYASDENKVVRDVIESDGAPKPAVGAPKHYNDPDNQLVRDVIESDGGPARPAVVAPKHYNDEDNQVVREAIESDGDAIAPTEKTPEQATPAWVDGARRFNSAHAALVEEFNELTASTCTADGSVAKLDPQQVAEWQRAHGLEADGKVGPNTLAAARKAYAKLHPGDGSDAKTELRPDV